jgi:hypothetical protein
MMLSEQERSEDDWQALSGNANREEILLNVSKRRQIAPPPEISLHYVSV